MDMWTEVRLVFSGLEDLSSWLVDSFSNPEKESLLDDWQMTAGIWMILTEELLSPYQTADS